MHKKSILTGKSKAILSHALCINQKATNNNLVIFMKYQWKVEFFAQNHYWYNAAVRNHLTNMGDINTFFDKAPFEKSRIEYKTETHCHPSCYYHELFDWHIVGTNIKVKILIRICYCRLNSDRTVFLQRKSISFFEIGNGVECHFDTRCHFNEQQSNTTDQQRHFRKMCYCRRPQASALR